MKKHNGMRPQDIVVLLKISLWEERSWYIKDLAASIRLSQSETSESIHRSVYAGLLAEDQRTVMRHTLLDFLRFGLRVVFPQRPGTMQRGVPTAHAAPPLRAHIASELAYVWPSARGQVQGLAIEPLYRTVPEAALADPDLYALLALCDALRVGRRREINLAEDILAQHLLPHVFDASS